MYNDSCIVFSLSKSAIDELVKQFQASYTLTDDRDVSVYLGIQVEWFKMLMGPDFHLQQPALIQQIITMANLKDNRCHDTPANSILTKGEHLKNRFPVLLPH